MLWKWMSHTCSLQNIWTGKMFILRKGLLASELRLRFFSAQLYLYSKVIKYTTVSEWVIDVCSVFLCYMYKKTLYMWTAAFGGRHNMDESTLVTVDWPWYVR